MRTIGLEFIAWIAVSMAVLGPGLWTDPHTVPGGVWTDLQCDLGYEGIMCGVCDMGEDWIQPTQHIDGLEKCVGCLVEEGGIARQPSELRQILGAIGALAQRSGLDESVRHVVASNVRTQPCPRRPTAPSAS